MKLSYGFLAFNNWPILKRTLESAKKLKHTQGNVQWVIVNNSTNDFYHEVEDGISEWCAENPNLSIWTVENGGQNTGEGGGQNQCFHMCNGEYILFFQDDWECVVDYPFIDFAIEGLDKFTNLFMIQLGKRAWSIKNRNVKMGRVLMTKEDKVLFQLKPNHCGNNTYQVRMFKKSVWEQVGPYPDMNTIDFGRYKPGTREGSIGELEYGLRLNAMNARAAKINDGQFIHTIPENARSAHFITNDS